MPVYNFVNNRGAVQAASDPSPVGGQQLLGTFHKGIAYLPFLVPITVVCIPSHSGLHSNDNADDLVKKATGWAPQEHQGQLGSPTASVSQTPSPTPDVCG